MILSLAKCFYYLTRLQKHRNAGDFMNTRDFLNYMNLYDAKHTLLELQNRRKELANTAADATALDELNNLDDAIVNAIIRLQRYEIAMS